jgi:hypothetical protein
MAVKVGFIGTGGISRPHRKHLKNMDDVEVVAMCDLEKDRVAEAAEEWNAAVYRLQNNARKRRNGRAIRVHSTLCTRRTGNHSRRKRHCPLRGKTRICHNGKSPRSRCSHSQKQCGIVRWIPGALFRHYNTDKRLAQRSSRWYGNGILDGRDAAGALVAAQRNVGWPGR